MDKDLKNIPPLTEARLKDINSRSSISSGGLQILHQIPAPDLCRLVALMPKQKIGYIKIGPNYGYPSFICDRVAFHDEMNKLVESKMKTRGKQ